MQFFVATIIIPLLSKVESTIQCLGSLVRKKGNFNSVEIILVDNGSTDSSLGFLFSFSQQYLNIKVIRNAQNFGIANANNQGMQFASGKYIILLNPYTYVTQDWLQCHKRWKHYARKSTPSLAFSYKEGKIINTFVKLF